MHTYRCNFLRRLLRNPQFEKRSFNFLHQNGISRELAINDLVMIPKRVKLNWPPEPFGFSIEYVHIHHNFYEIFMKFLINLFEFFYQAKFNFGELFWIFYIRFLDITCPVKFIKKSTAGASLGPFLQKLNDSTFSDFFIVLSFSYIGDCQRDSIVGGSIVWQSVWQTRM